MSKFEIVMPKMGESVIEATITKWLKKEGESVEEDESLVEIATDKVDSEIPSPVEGVISKILFQEGDTVEVGKVIAELNIEGEADEETEAVEETKKTEEIKPAPDIKSTGQDQEKPFVEEDYRSSSRFYSPLVKSIARKEEISLAELDRIPGTGKDNRVTKRDILQYIEDKKAGKADFTESKAGRELPPTTKTSPAAVEAPQVSAGSEDKVVEMDRMRRLIADHMVMSKQVSPHVTSFHEVDVTNIVNWRKKMKDDFLKRENEKLTFTPIFIEAAARALKDYPRVNASVDGYKMIERKNINIGMATALPNGNLIVPVIKNADQKNLLGLAKDVNKLANNARNNSLDPDDIQGGTFTVTNFGTFGNLTGSPIINQPQVAILGIGGIIKRPVVIETNNGDVIAIRHMMILSLAYDHRIVDGALGGMYLKRIAEYLENFDVNRTI